MTENTELRNLLIGHHAPMFVAAGGMEEYAGVATSEIAVIEPEENRFIYAHSGSLIFVYSLKKAIYVNRIDLVVLKTHSDREMTKLKVSVRCAGETEFSDILNDAVVRGSGHQPVQIDIDRTNVIAIQISGSNDMDTLGEEWLRLGRIEVIGKINDVPPSTTPRTEPEDEGESSSLVNLFDFHNFVRVAGGRPDCIQEVTSSEIDGRADCHIIAACGSKIHLMPQKALPADQPIRLTLECVGERTSQTIYKTTVCLRSTMDGNGSVEFDTVLSDHLSHGIIDVCVWPRFDVKEILLSGRCPNEEKAVFRVQKLALSAWNPGRFAQTVDLVRQQAVAWKCPTAKFVDWKDLAHIFDGEVRSGKDAISIQKPLVVRISSDGPCIGRLVLVDKDKVNRARFCAVTVEGSEDNLSYESVLVSERLVLSSLLFEIPAGLEFVRISGLVGDEIGLSIRSFAIWGVPSPSRPIRDVLNDERLARFFGPIKGSGTLDYALHSIQPSNSHYAYVTLPEFLELLLRGRLSASAFLEWSHYDDGRVYCVTIEVSEDGETFAALCTSRKVVSRDWAVIPAGTKVIRLSGESTANKHLHFTSLHLWASEEDVPDEGGLPEEDREADSREIHF